jgi:type I restriction enzyme S subunit
VTLRPSSLSDRWSQVPLVKAVDFLDHMRRPITASERKPGSYPYYGANGQQDSVADFIFDEPLVLLAEDGGHFEDPSRGVAYGVPGKCWVNNHAHVLRPKPDFDFRYLCWHLAHYDISDFVNGTTGAKLTKSSAERIPVLKPPLPEQRRIADILDKADAIRRKRKEAIALTEELLRSAFLEMFGDPVTNPMGWPVRSVDELCETKQYGTAEKANEGRDGLPVLRMNNLTYSGEIDLTSIKWVPLSAKDRVKLDLRDGDVLFNRVNSLELVGKTAVWHHGDGYTFAGDLIRLRFGDAALGDYVSAAMNMPSMKRVLMGIAKPSISMANISGSDLTRVNIPVPPCATQRKYRDFRRRAHEWRGDLNRHATEAETLFNTLVARNFSGGL